MVHRSLYLCDGGYRTFHILRIELLEVVLRDGDGQIGAFKSILSKGVVLGLADEDANGGVVSSWLTKLMIDSHNIALNLSHVGEVELSYLYLNGNIA